MIHRVQLSFFAILVLVSHVTAATPPQSLTVPVEVQKSTAGNTTPATATVPRWIAFNGIVQNHDGSPMAGIMGLTFALYREQIGGSPLWFETQNVSVDAQGRYNVLLGVTQASGLPTDLFASGETRWLGVQAQLPGEQEQPRVVLVSVPYALKAGDADTIGGHPASAFLLAPPDGQSRAESLQQQQPRITAGAEGSTTLALSDAGSINQLPKIIDALGTLGASAVTEVNGNVGIGTTSPTGKLIVHGGGVADVTNPAIGLDNNVILGWKDALGNTARNFIFADANNKLNFGTNNNTQVSIDALGNVGIAGGAGILGNVGIGTSSPNGKLIVHGGGAADVTNPAIGLDNNVILGWKDAVGNTARNFIFADTSNKLNFGTNNNTQMTIDASGNLGIAGIISGNGSGLTNINANNLTGTVANNQTTATFSNSANTIVARDASGNFSANLVTANTFSGNGSGLTNVNAIALGGATAASSNSPSTLVARDASGNFSANLVTANTFSGNGSGLTNVNASALGGTSLSSLLTRGITYLAGCDTCSVLADTDDQRSIYFNVVGTMTINSVTCFSDAGTPIINIQRDTGVGSPANVLSSNLTCSTTGATSTSIVPLQSILNLNDKLDFFMVTAGGTAKRITVAIKTTVN